MNTHHQHHFMMEEFLDGEVDVEEKEEHIRKQSCCCLFGSSDIIVIVVNCVSFSFFYITNKSTFRNLEEREKIKIF
jgi:hypothetical protein